MGCTANPACEFNIGTGFCETASVIVCSTLLEEQCWFRSDCHWHSGQQACLTGAPSGSCRNHNSSVPCIANSCVWDPYVVRCYSSLAEVSGLYPCDHWTNWPNTASSSTASACALHGCEFATGTFVCVDMGSGIGLQDNGSVSSPVTLRLPMERYR